MSAPSKLTKEEAKSRLEESKKEKAPSAQVVVKKAAAKKEDEPAWSGQIKDLIDRPEGDLNEIYDSIKYDGFDREVLKEALIESGASSTVVMTVAAMGAIRGTSYWNLDKDKLNPKVRSWIESNCKGFRKSRKGKGKKSGSGLKSTDLTILRVTSVVPDAAALFMFMVGAPKKIPDHPCPAYLQFPAAGSLPMSREIRMLHVSFCEQFSTLIGGTFNIQLYEAMMQNQLDMKNVPPPLLPLITDAAFFKLTLDALPSVASKVKGLNTDEDLAANPLKSPSPEVTIEVEEKKHETSEEEKGTGSSSEK